jgi:hypothetical protein
MGDGELAIRDALRTAARRGRADVANAKRAAADVANGKRRLQTTVPQDELGRFQSAFGQ